MSIKREQLTFFDSENLIGISRNDPEYFEIERVKTALSEDICTYGYKEDGKWIKISEAERKARE